jgi:glycosyltransferase involved in cell wall biosynthesis
VILCEWFGPNAVWYSNNRRANQRLVVRLHRFELYRSWPRLAAIDRIDRVICVSAHYARLALEATDWPAEKVTVISNLVDVAEYDRPKLDGAQFHLGFIGVAPARKRFDLALDILQDLRRGDVRWQLFAKTKLPWEYDWIWNVDAERVHFDEILRRIQTDPFLRGAVTFDAFGPDVATWLRRIGWVLSTSDDESFHLAPAEGMASAAVPVIRAWPGSDTIYDRRWIHADPHSMVEEVRRITADGAWPAEREVAQAQARASFDFNLVTSAWIEVLTANLALAEPSVESAAPSGEAMR